MLILKICAEKEVNLVKAINVNTNSNTKLIAVVSSTGGDRSFKNDIK